jgi:hypothetical protein
MHPTMYDSVSPPLAGGPAQDLGGAKQDPKASREANIIVDPNKKLFDALGNHEHDHENAPELNSREENEKLSELVNIQTTYLPENSKIDPISVSLNTLNSLLKQMNNPLLDLQTFASFVSKTTFDVLFAFFQFYVLTIITKNLCLILFFLFKTQDSKDLFS